MAGDFGTAIKDAIGLGLSGARGLAEGLGLAQPKSEPGMFGAPAQAQQEDLGDLNLMQQLSLRFQNAVESSEGNGLAVASGAMRQRRAAGNQQRMKAFGEGTKLLQDFDAIRDKASPADYERVNGLLRKRFAEVAGGQPGDADGFYDTFMSGRGLTPGMLELAQSDPGAQQLLAGGGSVGDLRKYLTTPERLEGAIRSADQRHLGVARNKLDSIGKTDRPELRQALAERMKAAGGRPTLAMIRDLAEAGIIPDELLPTANEWAALERNELGLADINFQANDELLKRREGGYTSQMKREETAAELAQQHTNAMELLEQEAKLGKFSKPLTGPRPATQAELYRGGQRVNAKREVYRAHEAKIDEMLSLPYNAPGSQAVMAGFVHSIDNTAAKVEEVKVLQQAAALKERVKFVISRLSEGGALPRRTFDEIKGILREYKRTIRGLHKGFVKSEADLANATLSPGSAEAADAMIPDWREFTGAPPGPGATGAGAAAAAPPAAGAAGQVRMRFPDGTERMVPEERVKELSQFGQVVQ